MGVESISITQVHLLSVINTEIESRYSSRSDEPIRILEVGCGNGRYLAYLSQNLRKIRPGMEIEVHGFDVHDYGTRRKEQLEESIQWLNSAVPNVPWRERVSILSVGEPWKFEDASFDIILSNQVLEHVSDHQALFAQIKRVLRPRGFSVHLFPLKHYVYEGHLKIPMVHRIQNYDIARAYIKLMTRIGFGIFQKARKKNPGITLDEYSVLYADYIRDRTNYLSYNDVLSLGKTNNLRTSFRYTMEFYTSKLRSLLRFKPRHLYSTNRSALLENISVHIFKYVDCITLFMEPTN